MTDITGTRGSTRASRRRRVTSVGLRRLVTPDLRIGSRAVDIGRQRGPRVLDKGQFDWRVHVGVGERGSPVARGSDTGRQLR